MGDRELLLLAAKAYGVKIEVPDDVDGHFVIREKDRNGFVWNPLKSDGDALRLAVQLTIHLKLCTRIIIAEWSNTGEDIVEPRGKDACAATRRAIVRAAEIGRSLP